ncbi:MAG: helix-turn-helix domain-containing protein, partial [Archaeoglobaceae archaeon]
MLSYRFRVYPSKVTALNLVRQLELCRWLYNRLLEELNKARESGQKLAMIDTQSLITRLKCEEPELRIVHSKPLQMVNYQLWCNLKALGRLKERGRRVGKLRFKKSFRTMNFNQTGFSIDKNRGKLKLSKIGEIPIKLHRVVRGKVKAV